MMSLGFMFSLVQLYTSWPPTDHSAAQCLVRIYLGVQMFRSFLKQKFFLCESATLTHKGGTFVFLTKEELLLFFLCDSGKLSKKICRCPIVLTPLPKQWHLTNKSLGNAENAKKNITRKCSYKIQTLAMPIDYFGPRSPHTFCQWWNHMW